MISILAGFFRNQRQDHTDDLHGSDMAPSPSVLAAFSSIRDDTGMLMPARAKAGPFTTNASAPIRES